MRQLSGIDEFGNIDANEDNYLEECFEEHQSYKDIINFKKSIVIGKKGAGKTSIYKKILNINEFNTFSKGYNLRSYPWHLHIKQANEIFNKQEKFVNSWMYLILIELSKLLYNEDRSLENNIKSKESYEVLEKFITDTYGERNPKLSNIFQPKTKLKFTSLISGKIGNQEISAKLPFEPMEMKNLPTVINEVNENLKKHVFSVINPENKYYLCFDELDFGFEKNDDYFDIIIGLIRASNEFNREAKSHDLKVSVSIFLRDDIYSLLRYEDKRKTTENYVTLLEWDTENTEYKLKYLMEKRFIKLLRDNDKEDITWDDVFDNMTTIDGKKEKYNYILRMTCNRPRDIIDFCNIILINYKKRIKNGDSSSNFKFINEDIINAKDKYSKNLKSEFQDEIYKHIQEFDNYLDTLSMHGKGKFTLEEFDDFLKTQDSKEDGKVILEKLFQFSVVGNYKIGGKGGGSENLFKYKNAEEKFRADLPIIIHPGLCSTLGVREK